MTIQFMPEPSGAYAVSFDGKFIGRVQRHRGSYEHSNGRTYRYWSWHAYPAELGVRATFQHRTRALAAEYLVTEDAVGEQAEALARRQAQP